MSDSDIHFFFYYLDLLFNFPDLDSVHPNIGFFGGNRNGSQKIIGPKTISDWQTINKTLEVEIKLISEI